MLRITVGGYFLVASSSFLNLVDQYDTKLSKMITMSFNTLPWRIFASYLSYLVLSIPSERLSVFLNNFFFYSATSCVSDEPVIINTQN